MLNLLENYYNSIVFQNFASDTFQYLELNSIIA